jgi:tripartite ATP-independent transporter DctM subunit
VTTVYVLASVLLFLALRVPVAFALLLPCLGYIIAEDAVTVGIAIGRIAAFLDSFPLLAVPLFIMVGFIANAAGMAERLVRALLAIFGGVRGSLGYVNVSGSFTFAWMSGSSMADAAAMGSVMIPSMRKNGYEPSFAAGLTGAASMIGPIMPPSVGAVIYAVLASASVGGVLIAGVVPAVALLGGLFIYVYLYARKRPALRTERSSRGDMGHAFLGAIPILMTPAILIGGILGGVFTPTEAAGVAVAYLLLLSLGCRWLTLASLYKALVGTATTTGQVMFIAAAGGLFAYVLAREQTPQQAAEAILALTDNPLVFLLLLNVFLLIVGTVLEPAAGLLITVPVVLPIALAFGIDPLHLGIIMILNLTIGLLTPPVGLVLYVLSGAGDVPYRQVIRGTLPTFVPLVGVLLLITYVPAITTWLPGVFGL